MSTLSPEAVEQKLKNQFLSETGAVETNYGMLTIEVKKDSIIPVLQFLFKDDELAFRFLTTMCGMHYPHHDKDRQFGLMYQLHNLEKNFRLRLKVFLPADKPEVHTATGVFSTANWMEREAYDFFGIRFNGHPDLRRILNMEDMIPFPMRKDFPLEDQRREDKNDFMFGR